MSSTEGMKMADPKMYAVIETGGKQYRVIAGLKIKVDEIEADVGSEIVVDRVLAVCSSNKGMSVGAPWLQDASVNMRVLSHGKHKKVRIFKLRKRKHYRKQQGSRKGFTELLVSRIAAYGEVSSAPFLEEKSSSASEAEA